MIETQELTDFENKWREIDDGGFKQILDYSKNLSSYKEYKIEKAQYLNLYNLSYNILMSKNQEIRNLCEQRIVSTLKYHCQSIYEKISLDPTLENFVNRWEIYQNITLQWVLKVFCYLSRIKCLIQRKDNLEKDLKEIFRQEVYEKVGDIVKQNFVKIITDFREHITNLLDIPKLKSFISFLEYFEIENDFLNKFVEITENYYKEKCAKQPHDSYINYLQFGIEIIQLETVNLALIVPTMTMTKLIGELNEIIFFTNYKQLLDAPDGFGYLLRIPDLNLVQKTYAIFSRSEETLNVIVDYFKIYVKEKYTNLINQYKLNAENKSLTPKEVVFKTNYIQDYISFLELMDEFVKGTFSANSHFSVVLSEVLENAQAEQENINLNYLLPFYYDKILSKSNYIGNENFNSLSENIKDEFAKKIWIFPYLSDKDIFITIHQNLLSDRLLLNNYLSLDCENFFLLNLQKKCGNDFTSKCEAMINDYISTTEIQKKYNEYLIEKNISFPIESSFIIISGENWPILNIHSLNKPTQLVRIENTICKFYRENFKGRSLQFSLNNSTMEINAKFPNKEPFTIICNSFQGIILSLFNTVGFGSFMTLDQINQKLKFEDNNDLLVNLRKILESGIIVENQNSFSLNSQFKKVSDVIYIQNEKTGENLIKKEKIEGDRTYAIEGHIAKILKDKKVLDISEITKMVANNLFKFRVSSETIENRIDALIKKEFIYRDNENPNIIHYGNPNDVNKIKDED